MRIQFLLLLACLPSCVTAADAVVRIGPEQAKAAAIATAPLAGLRSDGGRRLPAQAVVPPSQIEVVSAPLAGMVTAVRAAYGEAVRRGQVLATVQGPQLLELQRDFAAARADADVAAEARKRDETLFADGIVSRSRLAATEAADRRAQALLAEKRAALRLAGMAETPDARGLSGAAEIRAPYDAVVLEAPAQPGSRVDPTTPLFKLGRLAPLWLEMQATPAQAAGLAPGDAVRIPGCPAAGRLKLVAPHIDAATQTLLLRAELPNRDGCVRPFQFSHAEVVPAAARARAAWQVPLGALTRHQGKAWVFAETNGGFVPLQVEVLDETERSALIAIAEGASTVPPAELRIAVKGIAAIKAAWLGIGAGEGH